MADVFLVLMRTDSLLYLDTLVGRHLNNNIQHHFVAAGGRVWPAGCRRTRSTPRSCRPSRWILPSWPGALRIRRQDTAGRLSSVTPSRSRGEALTLGSPPVEAVWAFYRGILATGETVLWSRSNLDRLRLPAPDNNIFVTQI